MGWVSGQAYSDDLRARVLAAVDRGGRVYELAPLFEVSVSYIYKALARRRELGLTTALPKKGRPGRKLDRIPPARPALLWIRFAGKLMA
jgi:transposase